MNTTHPNNDAARDAGQEQAHTEHVIRNHDASVKRRARMEVSIIRHTIRALKSEGYDLAVDDGDGSAQIGDENKLVEAIMGVDTAHLEVTSTTERAKPAKFVGTVLFVMGNDGYDVIADYSVALEDAIRPVLDYCDRLAEGGEIKHTLNSNTEGGAL